MMHVTKDQQRQMKKQATMRDINQVSCTESRERRGRGCPDCAWITFRLTEGAMDVFSLAGSAAVVYGTQRLGSRVNEAATSQRA